MFFRPSYCANCGEKIERASWGILTSRRFCQVCESEYKGQDIIPRVIVGLGVVMGLLGLGGYLKSSQGVADIRTSSVQPRRLVEHQNDAKEPVVSDRQNSNAGATSTEEIADINRKSLETPSTANKEARGPIVRTVSSEPAYVCGAETKKGTPCSRRVKGNNRCFQHAGMPSMPALDESKIKGKR